MREARKVLAHWVLAVVRRLVDSERPFGKSRHVCASPQSTSRQQPACARPSPEALELRLREVRGWGFAFMKLLRAVGNVDVAFLQKRQGKQAGLLATQLQRVASSKLMSGARALALFRSKRWTRTTGSWAQSTRRTCAMQPTEGRVLL